MTKSPLQWLARARRFLGGEVWSAEFTPRTAAGRGLGALQFAVMLGESFVRDRLLLRASALTYFTVLSLIPVLAVAVSIVGSIGVGTDRVAQLVVDQIAAGSPEAKQKILELIEGANFRGLGTLGAVSLFVTVILGIGNIERALNSIWGVKRERPWARRFADYLAVLVVAPLMLGVALSLATTLRSEFLVQRLFEVHAFSLLYNLGLRQAPTVVLALAFGFLYWFLPNTQVRIGPALLGGLVAGIFVGVAQSAYLGFSIGVARANALFGGFAQLPLLLVWIYVFWAIVLFGAEIAFAQQNLALYRREVRGRSPGPAEREAIGLHIALEVARAFRDARPIWTADELADALRAPVRTVRDVLAHLERAGIVAPRGTVEKEDGFQLGRPAEAIGLAEILNALRGPRGPIAGDGEVGAAVERVLAEREEGAAKAAGAQTLADALAGIGTRQ